MDADAPDTVSFGQRVLGVATLAFMGWIALTFLRAFFDAYTPRAVHAGRPTRMRLPTTMCRPGSARCCRCCAVSCSAP